MKEKIFLIEQWKIFSTSFSGFIQTPENNYIFLENDLLENIFQKRHIFREMNGAFISLSFFFFWFSW